MVVEDPELTSFWGEVDGDVAVSSVSSVAASVELPTVLLGFSKST